MILFALLRVIKLYAKKFFNCYHWILFQFLPEKHESVSAKLSEGTDTSSIHSIDDGVRKLMLPTMWLGLQNGLLVIHSSLDEWKTPIKTIDLGDCVLCMV